MRAVRAIEHSDVCILMIDATRGFETQDQRIFHIADKNKKGIVILVNKWDLIQKDTNSTKNFEEQIKRQISPFVDIPIMFVSATEKQRLLKSLEVAVNVWKNRTQKISTSELNETMLEIIEKTLPQPLHGNIIKISFLLSTGNNLFE